MDSKDFVPALFVVNQTKITYSANQLLIKSDTFGNDFMDKCLLGYVCVCVCYMYDTCNIYVSIYVFLVLDN